MQLSNTHYAPKRHKLLYTYYDSAAVPFTATGLANAGNTCWLNATTQAILLSLPSVGTVLNKLAWPPTKPQHSDSPKPTDPCIALLATEIIGAVRGTGVINPMRIL